MARLDKLPDEFLANVLHRVPQAQVLASLPLVCRWVSDAGRTSLCTYDTGTHIRTQAVQCCLEAADRGVGALGR